MTLYAMVAIALYAWLIGEWMDDEEQDALKPALGAVLLWGVPLTAVWPIWFIYIWLTRRRR